MYPKLFLITICVSMCLMTVGVSAETFTFDEFEDGDITTNASGIGDGFEAAVRNEGSIMEEDGLVKIFGGNTGASRSQIGSKNSFSANGSPVFGIFSVTDMYRRDSADNGTGLVGVERDMAHVKSDVGEIKDEQKEQRTILLEIAHEIKNGR